MKISMEMSDLKRLLNEQSEITSQLIADNIHGFEPMKDGRIDKADITNCARKARFPKDVSILEKYLS